jgi:DNA-binding CsgD family transcriptional regulator
MMTADRSEDGEGITVSAGSARMNAPLTQREMGVLRIAEAVGTRNRKAIAVHLGISPGTVGIHLRNVRIKMQTDSVQQAVGRAIELGLHRSNPRESVKQIPVTLSEEHAVAVKAFRPDITLQVLNGDALDPVVFRSTLERWRLAKTTGRPMQGSPWMLSSDGDLTAPAVTGARVRQLVEEFLDTGLDPGTGAESPGRRCLARTTEALAALRSSIENPCWLLFNEKTSEMVVAVPSKPLSPSPVPLPDLIGYALGEADRLFTLIMAAGEWKYRLCKCRYCGLYFEHAKPRRSYLRGIFCCQYHQHQANAVAFRRNQRQRNRDELVDFVASWLIEQRSEGRGWRNQRGIRSALAAILSERTGPDPTLQMGKNWITWHKDEIEERRCELVCKSVCKTACVSVLQSAAQKSQF